MPRKSYIILSLILASVIASMAMPASAFYNLLQNLRFETGELDPWEADGTWGWSADISTYCHTGTYAALIICGDGETWFYQEISPPRCAEYLEFWYTFWYTDGAWGEAEVRIFYSDGTWYFVELFNTYEWTFVHIDLDTTKLVAELEVWGVSNLKIYVDDFDLEACASVGGELTQSMTPVLNPLMVLAVIAVASATVLGYRFTKR